MGNMIKLLFLTLAAVHGVLTAFNPFEETCPGRRQCLYDYETQKWVDRRGPLTSNSNPLYTTTGIARISRLQKRKRDFPKCECSSYTRKNTGGSTERRLPIEVQRLFLVLPGQGKLQRLQRLYIF